MDNPFHEIEQFSSWQLHRVSIGNTLLVNQAARVLSIPVGEFMRGAISCYRCKIGNGPWHYATNGADAIVKAVRSRRIAAADEARSNFI